MRAQSALVWTDRATNFTWLIIGRGVAKRMGKLESSGWLAHWNGGIVHFAWVWLSGINTGICISY